jgi:hypothetical protein
VLSVEKTFQVDDASQVVVRVSALVNTLVTWIVAPGGQTLDQWTIGNYGGDYLEFSGGAGASSLFALPCDEPGVHRLYRFPSLGSGTYTVRAEASLPPTEDMAVLVELSSDSAVTAGLLATQSTVVVGSTAVLVGAVYEGASPVSNCSVEVRVVPPTGNALLVLLGDDGLDVDINAGDGLYSGTFSADQVGDYVAMAQITGLTSSGTVFARQAATTVKVVPIRAMLTGVYADAGEDTNGNGLYERVRLDARVLVATPGDYILQARLSTPAGAVTLSAYGMTSLGPSLQTIPAYVGAPAFLAAGLNTDWTLTDVDLFYVGADGAEPTDSAFAPGYQTAAYQVAQFERPPLRLTGQDNDAGVDTDSDGIFDLLRVNLGVEARVGGAYTYAARLVAPCGAHLEFISGEQSLPANVPAELELLFSGQLIGNRGIDGPFRVTDFGLYGPGGALQTGNVRTTFAYSAQSFESYQPFVDCDNDGIPDRCELDTLISADCNLNLVLDACEHSPGSSVQDICWTIATPVGPLARAGHGMSFDTQRQRAVLFGGVGSNGLLGDTWEFDGGTWAQRAAAGPLPRYRVPLAYDAARNVTVLFGGVTTYGPVRETWTWGGEVWSVASLAGPSAREGHALAYDGERSVVVLHGGWDDPTCLGDTWEWDGSNWNQRVSDGPARRFAAMAFDAGRQVVVLFGGWNGLPRGDTWEWDGTTWTWRAATGPSARYGHAMMYDTKLGMVLLFGGTNGSVGQGDTWGWNGTAWAEISATGPAAREFPGLVFDTARQRTFLFGGWAANLDTYFPETWRAGQGIEIAQAPANSTTVAGEDAQFTVLTDTCLGSPTYQWWKDDALICDNDHLSGVDTATLTINAVRFSDAADYRVTIVAGGSYVTTTPVTLTVRGGGDMNCDGATNFDDINPFVLAVSDPAGYAATYPNCDIRNGDIDGDGAVTFDDINLFVELLGGAEDA